MRIAKVMVCLAGFLLMSLVLVSFQAVAHPDAPGIEKVREKEKPGMDPPAKVITKAFGLYSPEWWSAMEIQIAHNPLCSGHDDWHVENP